MPSSKRLAFVIVFLLILATLMSALALWQTLQPRTLTFQDGSTRFEATLAPGALVWPGQAVNVRWSAADVRALYFNAEGVIGQDERRLTLTHCDATLTWRIVLPDEREPTLTLAVDSAWRVPVLIWLLALGAIALVSWRGPLQWRQRALLALSLPLWWGTLYPLLPLLCAEPALLQPYAPLASDTLALGLNLGLWMATAGLLTLSFVRPSALQDALRLYLWLPALAALLWALIDADGLMRPLLRDVWGYDPYFVPLLLLIAGWGRAIAVLRPPLWRRLSRATVLLALVGATISLQLTTFRDPHMTQFFIRQRPGATLPDLSPFLFNPVLEALYPRLEGQTLLLPSAMPPNFPLGMNEMRWLDLDIRLQDDPDTARLTPAEADALRRVATQTVMVEQPVHLIFSPDLDATYVLLFTEAETFIVPIENQPERLR